jgi:MFS family permease
VALAALVLPFGAIGDRLGRRNVLVVGAFVFGAGALAAVWAESTSALILWRVVMGVGAAMIMSGTLATITAAYPAEQRARGVAAWSGFRRRGRNHWTTRRRSATGAMELALNLSH